MNETTKHIKPSQEAAEEMIKLFYPPPLLQLYNYIEILLKLLTSSFSYSLSILKNILCEHSFGLIHDKMCKLEAVPTSQFIQMLGRYGK